MAKSKADDLDDSDVRSCLEDVDSAKDKAFKKLKEFAAQAGDIIRELETELSEKRQTVDELETSNALLEARIEELETFRRGPIPAQTKGLRAARS